jgi:hypothetical protein
MGPDLYIPKGFPREIELALRPWNNVLVPETNASSGAGARAWTAYGKFGCLYFGSYLGPELGVSRCKETYEILEQMADLVCRKKASPEMLGFHQEAEEAGTAWEKPFCGYQLRFIATDSVKAEGVYDNVTGGEMPGGGLVVKTAADEFVLIGSRLTIEWRRPQGKPLTVADVENGRYENNRWKSTGPGVASVKGGIATFEFPRESGLYRQVRFKVREAAN